MRRELIEYTCAVKDCTSKLVISRFQDKAPYTEGWEAFPEDTNVTNARYACPTHSGPIRSYDAAMIDWDSRLNAHVNPQLMLLRKTRKDWQKENPPPAPPIMTENGWSFAADVVKLDDVVQEEQQELLEPGDAHEGDT